MGLDAETVALSPFGPSQSGRFYGINNLLETMLLAPALVGTALLGRWGVGVAALAFVTIGGNRFGADGGGTVVLAAALLVLLVRLQGRPLTWRLAALVAAGAVALALRSARARRRHRRLEPRHRRRRGRPRRAGAETSPTGSSSPYAARWRASARTAVVLGSLAVLAAMALRGRSEPVLDAFLVGLAVSLVVNDTPATCSGSAPRSRSRLPATRLSASR